MSDSDHSYSDDEIRALLLLSPVSDRENARQGRACLHCGGIFAAMVPVGMFGGIQLVAHDSCAATWEATRDA